MAHEDDIDSVYDTLRKVDKPFLKDVWTKAQQSNNNTVGEYFRLTGSLPQYRQKKWEDSIFFEDNENKEELEEATSQESTQDIDEVETEYGAIKVTKELKIKWGDYSNRDIIEMEKLYQSMLYSNDITTPQHKKDLYFYCKLSILADKALDDGNAGDYEKFNRQLDALKKSAGFRPIDRKSGAESSGLRSFAQVWEEIERDGFIEPYDIKLRQDNIDREIQYILNYQLKLMNHEQLSQPPADTPKVKSPEESEVGKNG